MQVQNEILLSEEEIEKKIKANSDAGLQTFFYQVKIKDEHYSNATVMRGIIEAKDNKEAHKILKEQILHSNTELKTERSGNVGDFVYEIRNVCKTPHWVGSKRYVKQYFSENFCSICGKPFSRFLGGMSINADFCSNECKETYYKNQSIRRALMEEMRACENAESLMLTRHPIVIYRIHDTKNNKSYVGRTIRAFTLRWWEHYSTWILELLKKENGNLSLTDFQFSILEVLDKKIDIEKFREREQYWIKKFDAVNNGYNSRDELSKQQLTLLDFMDQDQDQKSEVSIDE